MRKLNPYLILLLLCSLFSITACVEDVKDLYDPTIEAENPLETIDVPSDFDWKTVSTFEFEAKVADQFNNQYGYLIELFEGNPIINSSLKAIAAGYARGNAPFKTTITVPKGIERLYVRQTTPDKLASVRSIEVADGKKVVCDFSSLGGTRGTRSAVTRADITPIPEPTLPDITGVFPTTPPADAVVHNGTWAVGTAGAYKNLIINSGTTRMNAGAYCAFYITEDLSSADFTTALRGNVNRDIYIMPGVTVTVNGDWILNTNFTFSIGEGAKLIVNGLFKSGIDSRVYNAGTITANSVYINTNTMLYNSGKIESASSIQLADDFYNVGGTVTGVSMKVEQNGAEHFYNSGTITLAGSTSGDAISTGNNVALYNTNTISVEGNWRLGVNGVLYNNRDISITGTMHLEDPGNTLINDGEITCADFSLTAGAKARNNSLMTVAGHTDIRSADTWINHGTWITETMETYATGSLCINSCKLIVNEELRLKQVNFINDADSYVYAENLFMHLAKVELRSASFFNVVNTAVLAENRMNDGLGFFGDNSNTVRALLRMNKAIAWSEGPTAPYKVYYTGKMQLLCSDHFEEYGSGPSPYWVMDGGAEWADESNNTISILASECNAGWNTNPTPNPDPDPTDPTSVVDPYTYSYLFEDMWPLYGDYDMNDVVLRVNKITTYINTDNTVSKFSFDASIRAVGAEKRMGGAVMLDKISASAVKSVSYNINTPTTFNVASSGVEQKQTNAVIPLFDHVHKFIGNADATFINTIRDGQENVANPPTMTVTVEFSTPVASTDLNSAFLNFFIITDINSKPVNKNPRREIHIVDYKPTAMADISTFGNNNDGSSTGKYYRSKDNLPWGIVVPNEFKWPLERVKVLDAYTEFEAWVQSVGTENQEWWKTPTNGKVY